MPHPNRRPGESRDPPFSPTCIGWMDPGFRRDDNWSGARSGETIIIAKSKAAAGCQRLYQPRLRNHASRGLIPGAWASGQNFDRRPVGHRIPDLDDRGIADGDASLGPIAIPPRRIERAVMVG